MERWQIQITFRSSGRAQYIYEEAPTKAEAVKQVKARYSRRKWFVS